MIDKDREQAYEAKKDLALAPGWAVAVALREPVSGLACWVGEIQALDERGLRLTLVDWIIGSFTGWDFFIPWDNVVAVKVATELHMADAGKDFGEFQAACQRQHGLQRDESEF